MTWLGLALNGCSKRPLRSALAACGVAIAIAAAFALLAFQQGYRQSLWRELDRLGAHILVVPKGCPYDAASLALHGANWPCHLKASYLDEVRAVRGIATAAPVFMTAFFERGGGHTIFLGVDSTLLQLKPGWRIQGRFPGPGEVLLGSEIARRLQAAPGTPTVLPGAERVERTVAGVLAETHSTDDRSILMPLEDAQHLFGHTNELTHILVRLSDPNRLDSVVNALKGCGAGLNMNIVPLAHLFTTIQSLVASTRWFLGSATLVALLAAAAGISAVFLIAVSERTREIGVMRALGASKAEVFRLVLIEAALISLAGGVAGIVTAFLAMREVEAWLRTRLPFTPEGPLLTWDGANALLCIAAALILGALAALLPAWRAAELEPVRAIRSKGTLA